MAQRTPAELQTQIDTLLADNSSQDITAEDVRSVHTDSKDSKLFVSENLSDLGSLSASLVNMGLEAAAPVVSSINPTSAFDVSVGHYTGQEWVNGVGERQFVLLDENTGDWRENALLNSAGELAGIIIHRNDILASLSSIVLEEAELGYATDTKEWFGGDGSTAGGNPFTTLASQSETDGNTTSGAVQAQHLRIRYEGGGIVLKGTTDPTSGGANTGADSVISGSANNHNSGDYCLIAGSGNHNNDTLANYTVLAGKDNDYNKGAYCAIFGELNSKTGSNAQEGDHCLISGRSNYGNDGDYCSISGRYNFSNSGNYCSISGQSNYSNSGYYCSISGQSNYSNYGYYCLISGQYNFGNEGDFCSISGRYNFSNSGDYCLITGSGNHNNAATGDYCVIGGQDNDYNEGENCLIVGEINSRSADPNTGTHSIIGGRSNYGNDGDYCSISGRYNFSNSGNYCSISGRYNFSNSGNYCSISGKSNYSNSGSYCSISGSNASGNDLDYARVHGGGNVARIIDLVAKKRTTDATPTAITLGGAAEDATNRISIPTDTAWLFTANIIAKDSTSAKIMTWTRQGMIYNDGGTTTLDGLVGVGADRDVGTLGASVAITADNTNDALKIEATGFAATTIDWTARVEITQAG